MLKGTVFHKAIKTGGSDTCEFTCCLRSEETFGHRRCNGIESKSGGFGTLDSHTEIPEYFSPL